MTIEELVRTYNYKPLPPALSQLQREEYLRTLPSWAELDGDDCPIYVGSCLIAHGYSRIVIGDYGAYIEIPPHLMVMEHLQIAPGQEYRFSERYQSVKYYWLCPITADYVKIYWQKNTVKYADYIPQMFYISPYEVTIEVN